MASIAWLLWTLALADTEAAGRGGATTTRGWEAELSSPYFQVRRSAELRLRHLPVAEGREVVDRLRESDDSRLRLAAASWYADSLEESIAPVPVERLVAGLSAEEDPAVRAEWLRALSRHDEGVARAREAFIAGALRGLDLDELIEARVVVLFEEVMHDGSIPGFFDGQFARLHDLDPTVYGRLVRIAWDRRIHFVLRALAVMALHEPRRADLEEYVTPLLISARAEVQIQADYEVRALRRLVDEYSKQQFLVAKLSQYARFSMAKAGIDAPIRKKIQELSERAEVDVTYATIGPTMRPDGSATTALMLAMDKVFEVGYHYQQLDEYDAAEEVYRRILARPEPLGTKRWAHYNIACIRAIQGDKEGALSELRLAFQTGNGLSDASWAARDGDLEILWDDERFLEIVAKVEAGVPIDPPAEDGADQDPDG